MNLSKFYKGKNILITGHTGFKGTWLTQMLLELGANVSGLSLIPDENTLFFNTLELENQVNNHFIDITDEKKVENTFNTIQPEIVFHLAAQPLVKRGIENPIATYKINTIGTLNVLHAIHKTNSTKSCVIVTTDKVYNGSNLNSNENSEFHKQPDPYSSSKICAEIITSSYRETFFKNTNKLVATARAGNVIGGGDFATSRLIPDIVRSFYNNNQLVLRNPKGIRPWQHVLEPLTGYLMLVRKLFEGDEKFANSFNFGPDNLKNLSVEKLVKYSILFFKHGKYIVDDSNSIPEINVLTIDASKAKEMLGWSCKLTNNEMLDKTFLWYAWYNANMDMKAFTIAQIKDYFGAFL